MLKRIINRIKRWQKRKSPFTKDLLTNSRFSIGDYTYGRPLVLEYGANAKLKIGMYCSIASNVKILLGGNHRVDWLTTFPFSEWPNIFPSACNIEGHPATKGDVVIGNDVWIGHSCIILSGVNIGDGAVLAAGSLLSKNVGPYEIWGGNPARFIKKRFSDEIIKKLLIAKWWEMSKEDILLLIPSLMSDNIKTFLETIQNIKKEKEIHKQE